ncbi:MAG: hypothetical protein A4E64_02161 [Syntrophorhabdus sp. PtaU1.Bin058]|nr:MAG: hypothetical protein A4E64_02161 [Syntrophorhabdus sp. PtaU1.Bin058]
MIIRHEIERPAVINHITWFGPGGWHSRGFLPLYANVLKWDTDVKCPNNCPLAPHCHPMVQNENDKNCYHKLCTLTVIKAGLIKKKEIEA